MKLLKQLFILCSIEGFAAVLWTWFTPSESGRAVFLWLSPQRTLLLAVTLAIWGSVVGVTIWLSRAGPHAEQLYARLDELSLAQKRLGPLLILLFAVPLLVSAAVLRVLLTPLEFAAYQSWAPDTFPLLHALVRGSLPTLVFVLLIMVESGAFLTLRYRRAAVKPGTWAWQHVGPSLLLMFISIITIIHWTVLAFQLKFLVNIPAWYWKIEPLPITWRDPVFALAVLGLLALAYWILILRHRTVFGLILVFLLGLLLQFGVGIMSGGGLATFSARYLSTYHTAYVEQASKNRLTILENIQRYDELHGGNFFTSTKPPGLMAFYIGLDQIVSRNLEHYEVTLRFERLARWITFGFPVIAALFIFLIFAFGKRFLPEKSAWAPMAAPLLYVLCPNVVLFSLFPDQAIYPIIFLLGAWFAVVAVRRESLVWAFALGIVLYAAAFLAFTMLPLYPFAGAYLALYYWHGRSKPRWVQAACMAVAVGAGTLVLYLLCLRFLNYDFFPRFEKTVAINHAFDFYQRVDLKPAIGPESASTRLDQIVRAAWFNNLDFAAGMGFPMYILFAMAAIRLVRRLFQGSATSGDIILTSLLSSFVVLTFAGTAQGEVPRLWLFWMPMVLILVSLELEPFAQRHRSALVWLGLAQLVTIVLTYHFQDLRM